MNGEKRVNRHKKTNSNTVFDNNMSHKRLHDEVDATEETEAKEQQIDDDDIVLFIEYKYCTVCHIEQVTLV
jgi:hypothetical protein